MTFLFLFLTKEASNESIFNFIKKVTLLKNCNFIKKETLAQVFSCEFCEISKNTFFREHLWVIASIFC